MIKSSSEVARVLHQEHLDTLAAVNTLEEMIHAEARDRPPDLSGGTARQQLGTLIAAIDHDIDRFRTASRRRPGGNSERPQWTWPQP